MLSIACVLLAALLAFFGWLTIQIMTIKTDLATVKAEHENNGGSSMRDAIDRVEKKIDRHLTHHE